MTATGRLKVGKSLLSSEFQRVFGTFLRPEFSVFSEQCKKRFSLAVQKAGRFQTKGTCHDRQTGPLAARMIATLYPYGCITLANTFFGAGGF